jgi:hypothetical protein
MPEPQLSLPYLINQKIAKALAVVEMEIRSASPMSLNHS